MKRFLSIFLCILLCAFNITACAAEATDNLTIILQIDNSVMQVNGVEKEIDPGRGTTPILQNDRTLLPIRAVIEEMGGSVGWNGETQVVTLTLGEDTIRLTINSATAYLNDEAHTLDVAPIVVNDRTMLPIRFIAESFQFDVAWNDEIQEVTITKQTEDVQLPEETIPEQPEQQEPTEEPAMDTNKTLVIYFSATGNTEALAQTIAQVTNADVCEIMPSDPYTSEDLNYNSDCRANEEQQDDSARPEIEPISVNIDEYETIFLGYPIWWGTLPKVIYTFAETYDLSGKTIMPFCTSGGSGISSSVSTLRSLCTNSTVTDGFRGTASTTGEQIMAWLEQCGYDSASLEPAA